MAAKGKYTQATIDAIMRALELGASYRRAAASADINEDTFHKWRKTKIGFSERVEKAEATFVERNLAVIRNAAINDGTWQAAAWALERRYPAEYGKTVQEHSGEQRMIIEITEAKNWRQHGTAEVHDGSRH